MESALDRSHTLPASGPIPILVVDDEPDIVEAIARQLETERYAITTVTSSAEADALLAEHAFAVILADNMMPGLSGLSLLRHAAERTPQTRRVLVTGYTDADDAIQAFNDGVIHRYVRKPWRRGELETLVEEQAAAHARQQAEQAERADLATALRRRTQLLRNSLSLHDEAYAAHVMNQELQSVGTRHAALLLADVVNYTRLMHDDPAATVEALTARQLLLAKLALRFQGRAVNSAGDSLLAEFTTVEDAFRCAVRAQEQLAHRHAREPEHRRMRLRMGIAYGDVLVWGGEVFGDGVNLAGRLQALAEPGGICVAGFAWERLGPTAQAECTPLGPQQLKNVDEPVSVYAWTPAPLG